MYVVKLALRNLRRQKKRTFLLGGAIAFGIMIITLVNGFTAGAVYNLKENFAYLLAGHVYVNEHIRRDDDTVVEEFRNPHLVEKALMQMGIDPDHVMRRSFYTGQFIFSGRSAEQSVAGVDWNNETALQSRMVLVEGTMADIIADPLAVVLSEQIARRLGAHIGDDLIVRMSTVTGQQNVGTLIVRGIMQDPGILGSMSAYAHIGTVNSHLNIDADSFQGLHITISSMDQIDRVTDELHRILGETAEVAPRAERQEVIITSANFIYEDKEDTGWEGSRFTVSNINDYMGEIDQLSMTLTIVSMVILLILILITMVGVINTFRMIMYERLNEIGTMRAVGMQRKMVKNLFLTEAFFLAAAGYIGGLILAVIASFLLGFFSIPLENPFSLFTQAGRLTFPFPAGNLAGNFILISVLTVLAAYFPARKAARLQPADALRSIA